MAERTLKTRIALLYKSFAEWQEQKTFVPMKGEVCICEVPTGTGSQIHEPAVLIKIGDGVKTWEQLDWTQAKAADVYAWAKKSSLEFGDLDETFITELDEHISGRVQDTNTTYKLEPVEGSRFKYQLYKKELGETEWTEVAGSMIDVPEIDPEEVENRLDALEAGKVDKVMTSADGTARIFNEVDGGGAKFEHIDGTESFVGVNNGGEDGIAAQIYADKLVDGKWTGAKLDVTNGGIYYTVGNQSAAERDVEDNELVTKKDIKALGKALHYIGSTDLADGETVEQALARVVAEYQAAHAGYELHEGAVAIINADTSIEYIYDGTKWDEIGQEGIYETKVAAEAKYIELQANIDAERARAESKEEELEEKIEELEVVATPYVDDTLKKFFACGNPVKITDDGTQNIASFYGTNTTVKNPTTIAFPYDYDVVGGGNAIDKVQSYESSQIIINSGKLKTVYGGGLGACQVGHADIIMNGGLVRSGLCGGGQKGSSALLNANVVADAHITVNDGKVGILQAGGVDAVNVGHSVVDLRGGDIGWFYASGSNGGFINDSVINISGGEVDNLLGIVRGSLEQTTFNITGGTITNLFAGNDNDPTDDGYIGRVEINALGGEITTLLKGHSLATEDFICGGEYNQGVIGNEAAAVEACNLTEKILILNCNL